MSGPAKLPGHFIFVRYLIFLTVAASLNILFLPEALARNDAPQDRLNTARNLASLSAFKEQDLLSTDFVIKTWHRETFLDKTLKVYIEGDGFAWVTRNRASSNPTPKDPMGLKLALKDPSSNVAYLARPCQYSDALDGHLCDDDAYWTDQRFSQKVVDSMSLAIDQLKTLSKCKSLELIGYSGGGAIAVLLSGRRNDVVSLRTVAGNLDPQSVNQKHHVKPLAGSLDPMDSASKISQIPQRHFIGENDKIVPDFIVQNFASRMGSARAFSVTRVRGASHQKGWVEKWPYLLSQPLEPAENCVVE